MPESNRHHKIRSKRYQYYSHRQNRKLFSGAVVLVLTFFALVAVYFFVLPRGATVAAIRIELGELKLSQIGIISMILFLSQVINVA